MTPRKFYPGARARVALSDLSDVMQDYLRVLLKLQPNDGRVSTSALAERMGVAAPSATEMVKKLAALGLADHEPYRGVRLTVQGERIALELVRHHRLLEVYLAQTLGFGLDAVHAEADRLEHALSEELETRIDAALGSPTTDPHGDPIPDSQLRVVHAETRPLSALEPLVEATVHAVPDDTAELLRYLEDVGLVPGRRVTLVRVAPLGGPLTVRAQSGETAISRELADHIRVSV